MAKENRTAAILVIGDEILYGETQDTNSTFLCRQLTARGVDVRRIVTLPDESEEIITALTRLREYGYDYILTCGGIGPTPDDITRVAVARALGVDLVLDQTAVQRYEELRGGPLNEKQLEMCRLPDGSHPLFAESTGAPGFKVENIYVLPGVPEILQAFWERIESQFDGEPLHVETFVTSSRESEFASKMAEYQASYPELKFGSYPRIVGAGWEVRIRVRGRPRELVQEAAAKFMADVGGMPQPPTL